MIVYLRVILSVASFQHPSGPDVVFGLQTLAMAMACIMDDQCSYMADFFEPLTRSVVVGTKKQLFSLRACTRGKKKSVLSVCLTKSPDLDI